MPPPAARLCGLAARDLAARDLAARAISARLDEAPFDAVVDGRVEQQREDREAQDPELGVAGGGEVVAAEALLGHKRRDHARRAPRRDRRQLARFVFAVLLVPALDNLVEGHLSLGVGAKQVDLPPRREGPRAFEPHVRAGEREHECLEVGLPDMREGARLKRVGLEARAADERAREPTEE